MLLYNFIVVDFVVYCFKSSLPHKGLKEPTSLNRCGNPSAACAGYYLWPLCCLYAYIYKKDHDSNSCLPKSVLWNSTEPWSCDSILHVLICFSILIVMTLWWTCQLFPPNLCLAPSHHPFWFSPLPWTCSSLTAQVAYLMVLDLEASSGCTLHMHT